MNTLYIHKKSELTLIMRAFETAGMKCYRVRTECGCESLKGAGNRRDALLVVEGDRLRAEIIRCKGCAK